MAWSHSAKKDAMAFKLANLFRWWRFLHPLHKCIGAVQHNIPEYPSKIKDCLWSSIAVFRRQHEGSFWAVKRGYSGDDAPAVWSILWKRIDNNSRNFAH